MQTNIIKLKDNRTLDQYGDRILNGKPIFLFHALHSCRLEGVISIFKNRGIWKIYQSYEVAKAMVWLATESPEHINGTTIDVNISFINCKCIIFKRGRSDFIDDRFIYRPESSFPSIF